MIRYIFNIEYFYNGFEGNECFKKKGYKKVKVCNKIEELGIATGLSNDGVKNKVYVKGKGNPRGFGSEDYPYVYKLDPLLMLDTNRLVYKMIERANLDMKPKVKFVIYLMLQGYDTKKCGREAVWQTKEELIKRIPDNVYNESKIDEALKAQVKINDIGDTGRIFKERGRQDKDGNSIVEYSFNLTNLISYVNL